jgi:hypothetical protein
MRPVVCKPKVSMTSLCLTAAHDCRTGQTKGRYRRYPVIVVEYNTKFCCCSEAANLFFNIIQLRAVVIPEKGSCQK